jgi:2-keto-4-pentenoate hydratase
MPHADFECRPAAQALAEAMREGTQIAALPQGSVPATAAQGWQVAAAVLDELAQPAVGFRMAADGLIGPLLGPRLLDSAAAVPATALPGLSVTAAVLVPLLHAVPAARRALAWPDVRPLLGRPRPALDLAAWRVQPPPSDAPSRIADLAGLGLVVLGPPAPRAATPPVFDAVRVAMGLADLVAYDLRPSLVALAEAARRGGGLPAGAALLVAGLSAPLTPRAGASLACRLARLGRAEARLV